MFHWLYKCECQEVDAKIEHLHLEAAHEVDPEPTTPVSD